MATLSPGAPAAQLDEAAPTGAPVAFAGLLIFVAVVYANPGNWIDELAQVGFAKIAAGLSLLALGGSWLLYERRLGLGGGIGATLLGLFGWMGLSASWSFWPSMSVQTALDGLKYLAVFLLVVNVVDSRRRLAVVIAWLAWASLIPALGGIVSWSRGEHLVDGDRAAWIGVFGNPNTLAYHLVIGVALALGAREAARRPLERLAYLFLLGPLLFGILLTQSRGGMASAGVVLLLWIVRAIRRAPTVVGIAVTLACVLSLSPGDPWSTRNQRSMAFGQDMSARGRFDAWRTGLHIAKERPLTGVGAGAFLVAWASFAPGDAGPPRTEHNSVVQLVAELGLPALGCFLGALVAAFLGTRRAARDPVLQPYARGVQLGLAGFAVCSVTGGIAFSWPLYLLLGVAVAVARLARLSEVAHA